MSSVKESPTIETVSLGDVCVLRSEQTDPATVPNIPYVGLEHLDPGESLLRRWGNAAGVTSTKNRFRRNDVLFGKLRPYLEKSALSPVDGICSTDILVLAAKPVLDPEYLSNLTHTREFVEHAVRTTGGVNLPRTSWASLRDFNFSLPPLAEQRAIARALRAVQAATDARRRELHLERERRAALVADLFTRGTRGEECVENDGFSVPRSWSVCPLGKAARLQRGAFAHRPRNAPQFYGGTTPFIQTGDVVASGGRIRRHQQTLNDLGVSISKVFPKGTIIITIAANIGYTGVLEYDCACTDSLIAIQPNTDVDAEYLNFYLATQQQEMDRQAPRGTQKNINLEFLKPWPILLPPVEEQHRISDCLRAQAEVVDGLTAEVNLLDELFSALLEELMSGRLSSVSLIEAAGGETPT